MASPVDRKCTGSGLTPAASPNRWAPKWPGVPAPKVAMNSPFCWRDQSMNSRVVRAGTFCGLTSSTKSAVTTCDTGTKSFTGS